jgi:NADH-quinone oxidoreductase subunit G
MSESRVNRFQPTDIEGFIDGARIRVPQNTSIIEAADRVGIYIPRFCYHKKLSIAANCRMCLVEVEKSAKLLPACATPFTMGMNVFTRSNKTMDAQRAVMEFLLINHPLDCPICDQGGECELQDLALGYGQSIARFNEGKRSVADENLGSLIATDMTRCIQCTRCVRFLQEVSGEKELGAVNRGEHMEISTAIHHGIKSEISGNIIDLCPVGALTSKPFRFQARAWELKQTPSISPHDCLGSNLYLHSLRQKVLRVSPRENETVNQTWISDRDRYSYLGIHAPDRLMHPMIKAQDTWHQVDWDTALNTVVARINALSENNNNRIGALLTPNATLEECYLLQKLLRHLGSHHIDHRIRQVDFRDQSDMPLYPGLPISIGEFEKKEFILLIGSNLQEEQPLLSVQLRQAQRSGAQIGSINCIQYNFRFHQSFQITTTPELLVQCVAAVLKSLLSQVPDWLSDIPVSTTAKAIATQLKNKRSIILLGALAHQHARASCLRFLCRLIVETTEAQLGFLTEGANTAGAWLAGAIPHRIEAGTSLERPGLNALEMLHEKLSMYFLWNLEPLDCVQPKLFQDALTRADCVVAFTSFEDEGLRALADILLPISLFAETSGTFVNVTGTWQSFNPAIQAPEDVKPGWQVLQVLGNLLKLESFNYSSIEQVRAQLAQSLINPWTPPDTRHFSISKLTTQPLSLTRIAQWPKYSVDSLARRSPALQDSVSNEATAVYLNENVANSVGIKNSSQRVRVIQDSEVILPVVIDERIPDHCVWIPAGRPETMPLGGACGAVKIYVA